MGRSSPGKPIRSPSVIGPVTCMSVHAVGIGVFDVDVDVLVFLVESDVVNVPPLGGAAERPGVPSAPDAVADTTFGGADDDDSVAAAGGEVAVISPWMMGTEIKGPYSDVGS